MSHNKKKIVPSQLPSLPASHRPHMSEPQESEMEQDDVFEVAKLRKHIFAYLEKTTLAKCARVCTLWSDDALNVIWKELDSVKPLLSTVCPLVKDRHISVRNCCKKTKFVISDDSNVYRHMHPDYDSQDNLAQPNGSA